MTQHRVRNHDKESSHRVMHSQSSVDNGAQGLQCGDILLHRLSWGIWTPTLWDKCNFLM